MENEFQKAYRDLDQRMKALAEQDDEGVYLPNPEPSAPVDHIFICMEPSLRGWARSEEAARLKVASGFRNFLAGIEPMLLHFSTRRFLCSNDRRYYITDFSKGAMLVKDAGNAREERYGEWYPLLQQEIDLMAKPGARMVAVGKAVAEHLRRQGFRRNFIRVIHYSPLTASARNARIKDHEDQFGRFASSISPQEFLATAREVLKESRVPAAISEEAYSKVSRSQLSESRLKLIYCYKMDFEAMRVGK